MGYCQVCEDFSNLGFVVVNINDDELIDAVNKQIDALLSSANYKANNPIYSYNESARVVESYKHSRASRELATHPKILDTLRCLYSGEEPRPFSTINFIRSAHQPLHSDYAHFGTYPELRLAGSWIALEDIDPRSGPIGVIAGSHRDEIYRFPLDKEPKKLSSLKSLYNEYEDWVIEENNKRGRAIFYPALKKGDCLIWDANLLHGSPSCIDDTMSRKSMVVHWIIGSATELYNPYFWDVKSGGYVRRKIDEIRREEA